SGLAGEIGHVTAVADGGRVCGCGNRGCLETVASDSALAVRASEKLGRKVDVDAVIDLCKAGAVDLSAELREAAKYLAIAAAAVTAGAAAAQPPKLKVLFLGDNGHHRPADRFKQLQPVFAARNIDLTYTDQLADLNPKTLGGYDGLMIYANHEKISPEQEKAL